MIFTVEVHFMCYTEESHFKVHLTEMQCIELAIKKKEAWRCNFYKFYHCIRKCSNVATKLWQLAADMPFISSCHLIWNAHLVEPLELNCFASICLFIFIIGVYPARNINFHCDYNDVCTPNRCPDLIFFLTNVSLLCNWWKVCPKLLVFIIIS